MMLNKPRLICGVDEAGRGPLAGPVCAAAVILTGTFPFQLLADSKKLTPAQRADLEILIKKQALDWALGWAWPEEIDLLNIHFASLLAMQRAVLNLNIIPDLVLVDGRFCPELTIKCKSIVKGDDKIPQIMAASILAKTARDRFMIRYSRIEPLYQYEKHKGYPTKLHRQLLKKYGPSFIQRKSFKYA